MVWQAAARANRLAVRHPVLPLCLSAGRQARGQAGRQAGGQGCQPDGRKACRPFRPQRKGTFAELMSLCPCVAAFGADVVACGVPQPLSDPDLPPTFAPKRQGNAPGAYRRPRLRPSFGQPEGIGRPIPGQVGNDRFTPIRLLRIFVSSKTQQGVLRVTRRVFGYSENDLAPCGEGLPLRSREACFPTCGAVAGSCA